MSFDLEQLSRLKGVGKAKAAILLAAFELARRALDKGLGVLPIISTPTETIPLLAEIKDQRKEYFVCLYLNARNQVIHKEVISIGSLSASIVHPREVFQVGVYHSAASIILAHNHPSGDVSPSKDDIDLTHRLREAGMIMGIEVLDHIIIAAGDFRQPQGDGESSEIVSRRRDRLTKSGCRGARLTRRLSESYRGCTGSEGNAVSRDGSASQCRDFSATGH